MSDGLVRCCRVRAPPGVCGARRLSLSSLYKLRIRTEWLQYDSERGGYPLSFSDTVGVRIGDPVHASFANYQLTFTNIGAYNFIALPDRQVAQDFAARYGFDTHADTAANVILEVVFRLVDAPPGADSQTAVIRARILAGRIVSSQGQLIQAFPSDQVVLSAATVPGAALGPHLDTVKADTIQNIRIGMPQADAAARARVAHPDAACDNAADYDAYFDGIQGSATA